MVTKKIASAEPLFTKFKHIHGYPLSGNNISSPRLGPENPWICVRPLSNFYMYCVYAQKSHVSTCFIYTFLYIGNGAPDITKVYLLQQCVHTRQTYMYSICRHIRHICIMINARNIFCIRLHRYEKYTCSIYITILALTEGSVRFVYQHDRERGYL